MDQTNGSRNQSNLLEKIISNTEVDGYEVPISIIKESNKTLFERRTSKKIEKLDIGSLYQPDTDENTTKVCNDEVFSQHVETKSTLYDVDQDKNLGPSPIYTACSDIRECLKEYINEYYFLPSKDSNHHNMTSTNNLHYDQVPPIYPIQKYINIPQPYDTPVFINPGYGVFQYEENIDSPILRKSVFEISLSSDYENERNLFQNNHSFRKQRSTSSNSSGFWSNKDDRSPTFKETDL